MLYSSHFIKTVNLCQQRKVFLNFFFSSRRRHTSLTCDWSSDVCSSDLSLGPSLERAPRRLASALPAIPAEGCAAPAVAEIGRASCRERVRLTVVAALLNSDQCFTPPTLAKQ